MQLVIFISALVLLEGSIIARTPALRPAGRAASRCRSSTACAAASAAPEPPPPAEEAPWSGVSSTMFCNRPLNMKQVQAVGFDLDYTLAEYTREFDLLAHLVKHTGEVQTRQQILEGVWGKPFVKSFCLVLYF